MGITLCPKGVTSNFVASLSRDRWSVLHRLAIVGGGPRAFRTKPVVFQKDFPRNSRITRNPPEKSLRDTRSKIRLRDSAASLPHNFPETFSIRLFLLLLVLIFPGQFSVEVQPIRQLSYPIFKTREIGETYERNMICGSGEGSVVEKTLG